MPNRTYYLFLLIGTGAALLSLLLLLTVPLKAAQASDGEGTDAWLPTVQLQEALADPSVATVDGALHVVGGLSPAGPTNIHFQWAPQQATWQSMPAMPVPRADAVTFVVNHRLYVLGGYNIWYGGAISYTHSYDPTSHQWFTETAMLTPTSGAAGALIDGSIYVFGGFDNVSESSAVQSYDPVQRTWTVHSSMPL
ncbi:MAG: hypothetical protein KDE19_22815, partial [Caldilineaceae bacterium]|nr:hypothetical protein [Caldilineaceae bacterium]